MCLHMRVDWVHSCFNNTFRELLADAAARTVDKEYGVGTGVDEDEKVAKMAVVKSRLTRQLAGGVIKARGAAGRILLYIDR